MVEKRFKVLLLYIIFIMIIIISPSAYALEVDVTNIVTSPETSGTGKYRGTEILNTGAQATYNVKTRYQGKLSRIIFNLPLPSDLGDCYTTNATYTITMYMETNDWNNKFGSVKVRPYSSSSTNWSSGSVTYVSYKKIYFTFKIPSNDTTCYDFVWVDLPSTNINTTGITQISNWNLNKITLTDPTISSGGSGGSGGTSPTPTPDSSQAIIDSQNQNAQDIMENDDQNTQDIISSIQETTSQVSETITNTFTNKCSNLFNLDNYLDLSNINSSGTYIEVVGNYTNNGVNYVPVTSGKTYTISSNVNRQWVYNFSSSVPVINGSGSERVVTSGYSVTFQVPSGYNYFVVRSLPQNNEDNFTQQIMVVEGSSAGSYCPYGSIEKNKIDELNDKLDGLGRVIEDSQVDHGVGSNFFNDFDSDDNGGISAIVTKPLLIVNNLLSNNGQCSNLSLPEFMGVSTAYLPSGCILWNNATPTMINLWNIFVCGLGSYFILKDIFRIIENLKNPDNDKVEVMDL